jgi:hypothetical protein
MSKDVKNVYSSKCRRCNTQVFMRIFDTDVKKWMEGSNVQDAFPYLNAEEREMLISRICPTCWTKLFGEEE